ncbi:MAG: Gfo/Idh/MocA family oxidoreductase [Armatimonadetes bacterium]|nr:Gfo/Idh/MocA family oxidoreductase [Armatimonadota bacterium]
MAIKCAVVGYGPAHSMGAHHCNQIRNTPGLELVAVADVSQERREAAAAEQKVPVFASLTELLAGSDAELIVLVTPHDTHAPLAIEALNAGRHVVTEKVMCLTVAEADQMIAAASRAGKMLSVYHNRRWDGDYLTVRKIVEDGALGEVFDIQSAVGGYGRPRGWRAERKHGGGMLYDWGAHLVDQLVQMVPADPVRVYATMQHRLWDVDVETHAKVTISFANGCVGHIELSNISAMMPIRWLVRGEKGALSKDTLGGDSNVRVRKRSGEEFVEQEVKPLPTDWAAFYRNISAHLNEGAELAVKPEEVRKAVAVIEAAFRSAAEERAVELTELLSPAGR